MGKPGFMTFSSFQYIIIILFANIMCSHCFQRGRVVGRKEKKDEGAEGWCKELGKSHK